MIFAAVGLLATASRMLWAFAREQGLPGSSLLAKVSGGDLRSWQTADGLDRWNLGHYSPCIRLA